MHGCPTCMCRRNQLSVWESAREGAVDRSPIHTFPKERWKQQSASWWVLVVMVTVNGRPWSIQHCSSEKSLPTCRDICKDSLELQGSKEQCPISRASGSVS